MGQPTKCTEAMTLAICEHIKCGVRDEVAAQCEGICADSHYEWMRRGATGEEPYSEYSESVTRARALWEAEKVRELNSTMVYDKNGEPLAAVGRDRQWLMRHLRKEAYSDEFKIEVMDNANEQIISRLRAALDSEAFAKVLQVLVAEDSDETP